MSTERLSQLLLCIVAASTIATMFWAVVTELQSRDRARARWTWFDMADTVLRAGGTVTRARLVKHSGLPRIEADTAITVLVAQGYFRCDSEESGCTLVELTKAGEIATRYERSKRTWARSREATYGAAGTSPDTQRISGVHVTNPTLT